MALAQQDNVREILLRALGEPVGLFVGSDDLGRARQAFYATRRAMNDPELARLQFRMVELDGLAGLAIVKGEKMEPTPAYQPLAPAASGTDLPELGEFDL